MKEKINRFAKGIFSYDLPELILSARQLSISVEAGKCYEGEFSISNSAGTPVKCIVYSSGSHLSFPQNTFIGSKITVGYVFDARHVNINTNLISSRIFVVADCGETSLGLDAHIEPLSCETSAGSLRDVFHLANLAKADWLEAQKIFKSEEFSSILHSYHNKYEMLYRHLLRSGTTGRALEEFLIATNKKLRISYALDRSSIEYEAPKYNFMDKVTITKDTWGYGELHVESDSAFIEPERKLIWNDDFVLNNFELVFVMHPEKMHNGRNYGSITIRSMYQTLQISIMVHKKRSDENSHSRRMGLKHSIVKLTDCYFSYRSGALGASKCLQESEKILSSKSFLGDQLMAVGLYRIYLQICAGRESAARTALSIYKEDDDWKNKGLAIYGAVLFLDALLSRDSHAIQETSAALKSLHSQEKSNLLLFLFAGYLDKRSKTNRQRRYDEIKKQFGYGSRSRILYHDGAAVVCEDPTLLKELGHFERQLLNYGLKHDLLTRNVVLQISYLAIHEKNPDRLLLSLLIMAFDKYKINELLVAVCTLLVNADVTDKKYHKWFRMGVNEQLKIPKLHEYCLYTARDDMSRSLPEQVFLYFTYDREMRDDDKAYLYANLLLFREKNQDIYMSLLEDINAFAASQLYKGSISKSLALIYANVFAGSVSDDIAALLPNVIFKHEIVCDNKNICSVCVSHKELDTETIIPLTDGRAYIDLFTANYIISMCDETGNRYSKSIAYSLTRLINGIDISGQCIDGAIADERSLLNTLGKIHYEVHTDDAVALLKKVSLIEALNADFRTECERELIRYYYENIEGDLLEEHLLKIDAERLSHNERLKIIEFMILRELYHLALKTIEDYGYEGVDVKRLLKLCASLIPVQEDDRHNEALKKICHYVFERGKYNETVLNFLLENYNSSTDLMYNVWNAAINFGLDTTDIEERLLAQILFTENDVSYARDIFRHYYTHGCTHSLIRAFLSYYAFGYLRDERIPENDFFLIIRRESNYDENDTCMLALLKYYAQNSCYSDSDKDFIEYQLLRLEQKGLVLPFFSSFKDFVHLPAQMYDKHYVQYYSSPDKHVNIHYTLVDDEDESFITEEMHHVCCGIFVKKFVLFYGECLQYYITEESEDSCIITESCEVHIEPELIGGEDTKYHQLNLIITAKEMNDTKTVLKMLETYIRSDYESSRLFKALGS